MLSIVKALPDWGWIAPFLLYGWYLARRFLKEKPLQVGAYDNLVKGLYDPVGCDEEIARIRARNRGVTLYEYTGRVC
uniref:Uncharacterized protein n=1 Tax=Candidatus Kentrum sp. MB TaxID=2138164 RepID=A0A450XBJ6_9GAMM|nr:MAG: hypothetical protein BECKMB1821G_GA0114241_10063 [Candidatus Kentron sp. MB]VFK26650.1 MAG: hypothetical protein BECKMB1821I_GA0114274_100176 [Candidatus Kentron sp. MB]VFK74585.1 MAG: hypothetical protein BECKMB1821H_GA0114242_10073 [Candidatus Kentron sp. MB]